MKKMEQVDLRTESLFGLPNYVMGIEQRILQTFLFELSESKKTAIAHAVYGDWEHVALNGEAQDKCPSYPDMCKLKDTFWINDEVTMQVHPAQSEYVNVQPYTLHLWRWSQSDKKSEKILKNKILNFYDYAKSFYSGRKENIIISTDPKVVAIFGVDTWPEWEQVCKIKQQFWNLGEAAVQFNISSNEDLNSEHLILLWDAKKIKLPPKNLV